MKSKKILGLLLACTLGFSILPGRRVFAEKTTPVKRVESSVEYVKADNDAIIKMLIEQGVISEDAKPEEAFKALNEYLSNFKSLEDKLPGAAAEKHLKTVDKMKQYGIKQDTKNLEKLMMNKADLPQRVQEENFAGDLYVAKPLVILMDFPDYTFDKMLEEDLAFKYDNYDTEHFANMLYGDKTYKGPNGEDFITMKEYYFQQSGGSYTVDGKVAGWYTAEKSYIYYGEEVGETHDMHPRDLVEEALQNAAADSSIDLSEFDKEDRYDYDNDGNYNEPDGVIDHFVVVHAGMGQEQGGGNQGANAIWSHRWGFPENFIVTDSEGREFAVNDYTMQPQSGSVGVFSHEYGHDLGLPDEYDTQYTGYGEPVENWSIMSGGSWAGEIGGTMPVGFSPWAKQYLQASMPGSNWLKGSVIDVEQVPAEGYTLLLDEASSKGVNNDVVRINLPDNQIKMAEIIEGDFAGYSQSGTRLNNSMKIEVDLTGKTDAMLKFKTFYDIEKDWDFGSIAVKEAGTDEWTVIEGNITTTEHDPQADVIVAHGITGQSDGWVDAEFDLSAYVGKAIEIDFRYQTDGAVNNPGMLVDEINVMADEESVFTENFEATPNVEFNGFKKGNGNMAFEHYYLVEWRSHNKADKGLKFALGSMPYSPGMVMWYVNTQFEDNHVGVHPGQGFLGVIDADQQEDTMDWLGSKFPFSFTNVRIHDAAFGLKETPVVTDKTVTYLYGIPVTFSDTETFMNPYFSDSMSYENGTGKNKQGGLILQKYGLKIYVTGNSKDMSVGRIHVMRTDD